MASQRDVRRIALSLPRTVEEKDRFAFAVVNKGKPKGYAWVWLERLHPKKARVPNPEVLAVRVANLEEKEMLLSSDDGRLFTEAHYNGYPAVLVQLRAVTVPELEALVTAAWRCQAPPALVEAFDAGRKPSKPRRSLAGR